MSGGKVFRDSAEELGIKAVLDSLAQRMAGNTEEKGINICACTPNPIVHFYLEGVRGLITHDLTCPQYRFVIICGSDKDREILARKAYDFVQMCQSIVNSPDAVPYGDVMLARKTLCLRE